MLIIYRRYHTYSINDNFTVLFVCIHPTIIYTQILILKRTKTPKLAREAVVTLIDCMKGLLH